MASPVRAILLPAAAGVFVDRRDSCQVLVVPNAVRTPLLFDPGVGLVSVKHTEPRRR